MSQSSNPLRRALYGLWLDPFFLWFLPYDIFLALTLATLSITWLLAALGCVFARWLLQAAAARGSPRFWVRSLTPNFYAVRCLSGRWSISVSGAKQPHSRL